MLESEHLLEATRHNTLCIVGLSTRDSVGLSRASLTIGEDADIVAVKSTLNKHSGVLKDLLLSSLWPKDTVKHELFDLVLSHALEATILLVSNPQRERVHGLNSVNAAHLSLILVHGSDPAVDSNLTLHVLNRIVELLADQCLRMVLLPQRLILLTKTIMALLEHLSLFHSLSELLILLQLGLLECL